MSLVPVYSCADRPATLILLDEPDEARPVEALQRFERVEALVRPRELQAWAEQFSEAHFLAHMRGILAAPVEEVVGQRRALPWPT